MDGENKQCIPGDVLPPSLPPLQFATAAASPSGGCLPSFNLRHRHDVQYPHHLRIVLTQHGGIIGKTRLPPVILLDLHASDSKRK